MEWAFDAAILDPRPHHRGPDVWAAIVEDGDPRPLPDDHQVDSTR